MTHAERLLWLAELIAEGISSAFHPIGSRVPLFPTLRRTCPKKCFVQTCSIPESPEDFSCSLVCGTCQGRGFVPVDNLEATMEAISAPVAFDYTGQGWTCNLASGLEYGVWTTWCETPNEAAVLALYEREIAETKP